jgi:protein-ribulosamine 3-kinase
MLFLCEKYAPLESLEKYSPEKDISVTGAFIKHPVQAMTDVYLNGQLTDHGSSESKTMQMET